MISPAHNWQIKVSDVSHVRVVPESHHHHYHPLVHPSLPIYLPLSLLSHIFKGRGRVNTGTRLELRMVLMMISFVRRQRPNPEFSVASRLWQRSNQIHWVVQACGSIRPRERGASKQLPLFFVKKRSLYLKSRVREGGRRQKRKDTPSTGFTPQIVHSQG